MVIELQNIQSILSARYDIPEKGVTQITGDNSNGKSILIKAVSFVANNKISDKDERETIINDNFDYGVIRMSRNGMTLTVNISRARENCYYELKRRDGTTITRSIREGGLEQLSSEFGWVAFDGNICLQIFETFGIMPFVNNRQSSDYEIIDFIITDKIANSFIDTYEKMTYPAFREKVATLKATVKNCQDILNSISFYDVPSYEDMLYKLKYYQRIISYMIPYEPTPLPITKYLKYSSLIPVEFNRLPIFRVFPSIPEFKPFTKELQNYASAVNGVCPTCGVKFSSLEEYKHNHC